MSAEVLLRPSSLEARKFRYEQGMNALAVITILQKCVERQCQMEQMQDVKIQMISGAMENFVEISKAITSGDQISVLGQLNELLSRITDMKDLINRQRVDLDAAKNELALAGKTLSEWVCKSR